MPYVKCHCNGSRGTDCDWCGGMGKKFVKELINKKTSKKTLKNKGSLSTSSNNIQNTGSSLIEPSTVNKPENETIIENSKDFNTVIDQTKDAISLLNPVIENLNAIEQLYLKIERMDQQFLFKQAYISFSRLYISDVARELIGLRRNFFERFSILNLPKQWSSMTDIQIISLQVRTLARNKNNQAKKISQNKEAPNFSHKIVNRKSKKNKKAKVKKQKTADKKTSIDSNFKWPTRDDKYPGLKIDGYRK